MVFFHHKSYNIVKNAHYNIPEPKVMDSNSLNFLCNSKPPENVINYNIMYKKQATNLHISELETRRETLHHNITNKSLAGFEDFNFFVNSVRFSSFVYSSSL